MLAKAFLLTYLKSTIGSNTVPSPFPNKGFILIYSQAFFHSHCLRIKVCASKGFFMDSISLDNENSPFDAVGELSLKDTRVTNITPAGISNPITFILPVFFMNKK